ncbi:hypothetical protein FPZ43_17675 [Mucilaginibacter pallidiroseus]|uniref:DoxX family protein n=1 Tax=Mucilaginibacter pallidiroseus TaxID=2599295 RepID=A0A563TZD1_9SPHI|nr:hypothetical protein [Mucilaginibacter pallidiroseus]TWR24728.1 hypothetical protein FPZ43_17675 [Mucilaginibacter pallidiroseus]
MSVEETIQSPTIGNLSQDKTTPLANRTSISGNRKWTFGQKFALRTATIFFTIMSIPWSVGWYKSLFAINWFSIHYRDLYDIARFQPSLYRFENPAYNLLGYGDWVQVFAIALVGAGLWSVIEKRDSKLNYDALYYWVRVIARYRAGIGIIGFGFTKLFPTQMPYPGLGLLNTNFGDFTAQKIYWLSVGIVPWYQVFAGIVEVLAGSLLFFRKTTTLGAALLIGALGDITYVNFAYDGGVHVYASYFVLFAAFLLWYDAVPVYNLFIREKYTAPYTYQPSFKASWLRNSRLVLKVATIFIFLVYFTYAEVLNFKYDPYKQPAMSGVPKLRGNYHVSEFKINGKEIPYSPLDSIRWRDVTFEKWSSLSYNVNRPTRLDLSNGGGSPMRDINRTFELTGTAGGKRVFYYDVDTLHHTLYLQDKYVDAIRRGKGKKKPKVDSGNDANWIPKDAKKDIQDEYSRIDPVALSNRRKKGIAEELKDKRKRNHMILNYQTTDGNHVILNGIDEHRDSVYIVLDRFQKNYVLKDSKLEAGKYQ